MRESKQDNLEPGRSPWWHPFLMPLAIIVAAFIGGYFVLVDDDPKTSTPAAESDRRDGSGQATTDGGNASQSPGGDNGAGEGNSPTRELPAPDGNSRLSAKPLAANEPEDTSLSTSNDVDWFVYQAPRNEDVKVEFTKGEGIEPNGSLYVNVWEEAELAKEIHPTSEKPDILRRSLTKGTRLYVQVEDDCGTGCGIGPYQVLVQTAPPG